ncbi:MAG: tRNA uridine-5-carboxymethylaminomethyl(34) synthesis GTPase MnmE [Sphingobium sp.]
MPDTIFALSSGRPPAGIAVIRISGPQAFDIQRKFLNIPDLGDVRHARVRALYNPADGQLLDRALTLHFARPHSVTGEDMVEWHCHGGRAVVDAVLGALGRINGAREAQPGEFTRRAFENGKIDLNEAEGLADLLSAETEGQRRAALAMAEGHFSRRLNGWREEILIVSAMVEAALDFSDEDDVPDASIEGAIIQRLQALRAAMAQQLALPSAERLRDGIRVVLAGPPNVGKSTLLNALVGREAAIVSDIAGTTRDRIEVPVQLGGVPYLLTDTAGLRDDATDSIEQIGVERTRAALEQADIILWLGEPDERPRGDAVAIAAQMDRAGWVKPAGADLALSARTGEGMAALVGRLVEAAQRILPMEAEYALYQRQRDGIGTALGEIDAGLRERDMLLVAESLRIARTALDRLIGRAGVEDMLDILFGRFCIGK